MKWLHAILDELVAMFVDDWHFALPTIVWPALVWLAITRLHIGNDIGAVILFAGLAAILVLGALRRAHK